MLLSDSGETKQDFELTKKAFIQANLKWALSLSTVTDQEHHL